MRTLNQLTEFKAKLYNTIGRYFNEMEHSLALLIDQIGRTNLEQEYRLTYDKVVVQLNKTEVLLKQNPESSNDQNSVFASVINEKINNLIELGSPYYRRLFVDENFLNVFHEDIKKIAFLTTEVVAAPRLPMKSPQNAFLPNSTNTQVVLPQSPNFDATAPRRPPVTPGTSTQAQGNQILSPQDGRTRMLCLIANVPLCSAIVQSLVSRVSEAGYCRYVRCGYSA
jgi:hypothetical protein